MAEPTHVPDILKRVTEGTIRALSATPGLSVCFGEGQAGRSEDSVILPAPLKSVDIRWLAQFRGRADTLALRRRYHDPVVHGNIRPKGNYEGDIFDVLESVRVEVLGSRVFAGVAENLSQLLAEECRAKGYDVSRALSPASLAAASALLVRERLTGIAAPVTASALLSEWRPLIAEKISPFLDDLDRLTENQHAYGRAVINMLRFLDINIQHSRGDENAESEQSRAANEDVEQRGDDNTRLEDSVTENTAIGLDSQARQTNVIRLPGARGAGAVASRRSGERGGDRAYDQSDYKVYTDTFDEIVMAEQLCDPEELTALRQQLDQQVSQLNRLINVMANRLQRRLMARQRRMWDFDLEEGLLDAARLSRVVASPTYSLSFKQESEVACSDTVVSLLIDNSGSMRGWPITVAATSADILARTLERCGVRVEILGFTTASWKGGASRDAWVTAGKPAAPGRLNDIRHIVYKSADRPWRRVRKNLALMLKKGLLKENIDGEALLWAHGRLLARPEQRRIMMVISDGDPVDNATLAVNPEGYLEEHLQRVASWIETHSRVELLAIGIGHDVSRYYRRAVMVEEASDLGKAMMQAFIELFDNK